MGFTLKKMSENQFVHRTIQDNDLTRGVMTKAVICAYARTPIGKFRGALSNYSATELGSKVVEDLLKK